MQIVTRAAFAPRVARVMAARVVAARVVAARELAASTVSSSSTVHDLTARSVWRSTKSFSGPSLVSRPPAQPLFSERYAAQRTRSTTNHVNRDV